MKQSEMQACENTDRKLWTQNEEDSFSPSIHVTREGGIGINVGGHVIVMPLERWHALAVQFRPSMRGELTSLLNKFCAENPSNTPDFILAGFLLDCLAAWDHSVQAREKWYGRPIDTLAAKLGIEHDIPVPAESVNAPTAPHD